MPVQIFYHATPFIRHIVDDASEEDQKGLRSAFRGTGPCLALPCGQGQSVSHAGEPALNPHLRPKTTARRKNTQRNNFTSGGEGGNRASKQTNLALSHSARNCHRSPNLCFVELFVYESYSTENIQQKPIPCRNRDTMYHTRCRTCNKRPAHVFHTRRLWRTSYSNNLGT